MAQRPKILLVDDDPVQLEAIFTCLAQRDYQLLVARSGETALRIARAERPAVVILDVLMEGGMDGFATCEALKEDPRTRSAAVLFLSALEAPGDRVAGLAAGAVDFITKPIHAAELLARVETQVTLQALRAELEERNQQLGHELRVARALLDAAAERVEGPLLGTSEAIRGLREQLIGRAQDDEPVLIVCPPGAGAEAAARWLHARSSRRDRPFITVNAEQLNARSTSSGEGTGEERGEGPGEGDWLELAQHGILYIQGVSHLDDDQLAAISADVGEPGTARIVGSLTPSAMPAFEERWESGTLLMAPTVEVPPLRERREDIPVLVAHFLKRLEDQVGRPFVGVTEASMRSLQAHHWPGNIAELRSLVERVALAATTEVIEIDEAQLSSREPVGSYQLIELLAVGGMGQVWRARHRLLARPAAVKLIGNTWMRKSRRDAMRMFRDEAQATARLRSPHTVTLYDFGVTDSGDFFYVMELLEGLDLAQLVRRHGPMAPARVVHLLVQACRSLAEAHELGIVHRDLKPSNLFLGRRGLQFDFLTVLDFGITIHQKEPGDVPNHCVGTTGFSAPEVLTGQSIQDGRADVYSLGAVAYFLLTGHSIFHLHLKEERAELQQKAEPPRPSAIMSSPLPRAFEDILVACLNPRPEVRPPTVQALERSLAAVDLEPWSDEQLRHWWETHEPERVSPVGVVSSNLTWSGSGPAGTDFVDPG